jgi:hypothetical protein
MTETTQEFFERMKDHPFIENMDIDMSRLIEWEKKVIPVKTPFYNNKVKES